MPSYIHVQATCERIQLKSAAICTNQDFCQTLIVEYRGMIAAGRRKGTAAIGMIGRKPPRIQLCLKILPSPLKQIRRWRGLIPPSPRGKETLTAIIRMWCLPPSSHIDYLRLFLHGQFLPLTHLPCLLLPRCKELSLP